MSVIEQIDRLRGPDHSPIGLPIPDSLPELAEQHHCSLLVKTVPFGEKFPYLLDLFNKSHEQTFPVRPEEVVEFSNQQRAQGFLWMQAIRHIGDPQYKLIGQEDKLIGSRIFGKENSPNASALMISLLGLTIYRQEPDLVQRLLDGKISTFTLGNLEKIHTSLGGIVRTLGYDMNQRARDWRNKQREITDQLPNPLKRLYYVQDGDNIKEVYAVYKLSRHPALGAWDWRGVFTLADRYNAPQRAEEKEIARAFGFPKTPEELKTGRRVFKLCSQMSIPLLGYLLHTSDPTP